MNTSDMNKSSETNWERVDALTDETIDTSDIPPLSEAFLARATLRMPQQFTTVTVQLDSKVWTWFEAQGENVNGCSMRHYVSTLRPTERTVAANASRYT